MSVPPDGLDRQVGRSAFGSDAAQYDRARSGYPAELFGFLASQCGQKPKIAEIGAGTGIASAGLLDLNPTSLTLIEPDPRLCEFLSKRFANDPVAIVCATFPTDTVEESFDLVACAAAFHWMEPLEALARIRSMLTPGGTWAMWWNCYFGHGIADPFSDRLAQIMFEEGVALPPSYRNGAHYAFDIDHHIGMLDRSGFASARYYLFKRHTVYTTKQAVELCQTFSFVSTLPAAHRDHVAGRVAACVDCEFGGSISGLVATGLYVARS
ncbi:MAG: class I SAM-dependent methyltransferase [Pseudomonadota bacterium]|jgi:ubiquinone/menaquinone biosynthesis C-methylase UbiE